MSAIAANTTATIIPSLRYRNALAAIDWLCNAFGFEKQAVYAGDDGVVHHAQLTFGNGMIMLGSQRDDDFGKLQKTPAEVGGIGTQSAYIIVADADAHHDRAVAAGAEITMPLTDLEYGSRDYGARDPEGNRWSFGTYAPG